MYSLTLYKDGEPVTLHDIHNFEERSAVEMETNLVFEAVAHLRCSTHDEGVHVNGTVQEHGRVTFFAHACCDAFRETAQENLAHLPVAWA